MLMSYSRFDVETYSLQEIFAFLEMKDDEVFYFAINLSEKNFSYCFSHRL